MKLLQIIVQLALCFFTFYSALCRGSTEGEQLLAVTKGVVQLINLELISAYQFSTQVQYLSGTLIGDPFEQALIDTTTTNISATTADIMYGLYVSTSVSMVGVALTLSSGSYLEFTRDLTGVVGTMERSVNATCKATGDGLGSKPFVAFSTCEPRSWTTYSTAAAQKGHGLFATPVLSSVTSALGPVAVLPYSAALTNQTTGEVLGVATANITLTASTTNLFDFPNTVYYVMTAKGSNFLLLSNSVGESLDANGSLFPAYKAQNMVIRKSAEFVAQLTNIPSKGAYYTVEGGNASMVFAVAPCTDATNTLHVLVVTATYLPSVFTPTNSTTCSDGSVAPQASLVGPELTADVLATYAGIMLDQSITFGKSIAFLAGGGAPLNLSPYPILLNDNDSSSLQILRGMMNAYGFPYGNDFVYECALVDDSSGAYSGFTITNTVFVANASCPNELISGEGIVYPPVNSSCLLVYFTDRQNEPMNPAYKQLQYDVRSQGWYQKVKSTGLPSTYGAFKEPAYNQEGIGIAIPVYGEDNQFLGAVEVFMQTVILTRSNLAKGVNMSYLMTSDRTVIGTSENPIASLTIDGAPIEAIDYVNAVVAASASYIVGNAIYLQNVYLSPLSEALMMQMAISHALIPTRSSINWVVVSVTVLKSQHPSPVVTPVNPSQPGGDNSSSGNSSSSLSGLELAAIVVGSLGLAGFVLVLAMWLYSRQTATQLSHTAAQKTAAAAEVELGAMDTVNPIAHSTVP